MKDYDVIVCGGGPAGIGAAVAAGFGGIKTLLIEKLASVGGISTAAFNPVWGDTQKGWISNELEKRLTELDAGKRNFKPETHLHEEGRFRFHGETMKAIELMLLREAGVDILLDTVVEGAELKGDTVTGVYVANKGGRSLINGKVIIDATADGDVAASAGAEFMKGDPEDGRMMHVNYKFQIEGIDWEAFEKNRPSPDQLEKLFKSAVESGEIHPPSGAFRPAKKSFPYHKAEDAFALSKWEIEDVDCSDPYQVSKTLVECQVAAFEVSQFCRKNIPEFKNCRIERFPAMLGSRESRRITGKHILNREDVLAGRKFDDGITEACFFMDFHDSPPGTTVPYTMEEKLQGIPPKGDWYEIPYRCLIPEKIKALLTAGRCISVDRSGQASMRVKPTCMFTGEAAGTAAVLAVNSGILPHELDGSKVREKMKERKVFSR
ncbi:MAG: FAD-dependent oxidoreductase [Planctomycetota bacterium]|jgi:hypothetical protein